MSHTSLLLSVFVGCFVALQVSATEAQIKYVNDARATTVTTQAGPVASRATSNGGGSASVSKAVGGPNFNIVGNVSWGSNGDPDQAFYGLALPVQKLYRGVIPGLRDTLPHIRRAQVAGLKSKKSSRLTWMGYQRMPDKSRVFLQTFGAPAFRVERGKADGEILVILQDTGIGTYNFKRNMDTRYFPRAIAGIRSYKKGRDTYVSIKMRHKVEFSISMRGNYLFVDFDDAAIEARYMGDGQVETATDLNGDNVLREIN